MTISLYCFTAFEFRLTYQVTCDKVKHTMHHCSILFKADLDIGADATRSEDTLLMFLQACEYAFIDFVIPTHILPAYHFGDCFGGRSAELCYVSAVCGSNCDAGCAKNGVGKCDKCNIGYNLNAYNVCVGKLTHTVVNRYWTVFFSCSCEYQWSLI